MCEIVIQLKEEIIAGIVDNMPALEPNLQLHKQTARQIWWAQ